MARAEYSVYGTFIRVLKKVGPKNIREVAANALWCTRLPARQLILGSEWTCYNRDFDINELLPFCASFEQ